MMKWRKTKQEKHKELLPELLDPFSVIPIVADGVEVRADEKGRLQVRRSAPQAKGIWGSRSTACVK